MAEKHPCDTVKLWPSASKRILIVAPYPVQDMPSYQETLASMGHQVCCFYTAQHPWITSETLCFSFFESRGPELLFVLSRDPLWSHRMALWGMQHGLHVIGAPPSSMEKWHSFAWHTYARSKNIPCIESMLLRRDLYASAPLVYPHRVYAPFQRFQAETVFYPQERHRWSLLSEPTEIQNPVGKTSEHHVLREKEASYTPSSIPWTFAQQDAQLPDPKSFSANASAVGLGNLREIFSSSDLPVCSLNTSHVQKHPAEPLKPTWCDAFSWNTLHREQKNFAFSEAISCSATFMQTDRSCIPEVVIESIDSDYEIHVPLLGKTPLTPMLCSRFSDPHPLVAFDPVLYDQLRLWVLMIAEKMEPCCVSVSLFQYDLTSQTLLFTAQDVSPDLSAQSPTALALIYEGYTYAHLLAWLLEQEGVHNNVI